MQAQLAGLFEVPVIVRELDNTAVAAVALIENIQREDLNPLEEAGALLRLQADFSMTHQQIAEAVGRSRAAVSNLLRLHDLHEDVKTLLHDGKVEMGHARAMLSLSADQQPIAALKVVSQSLSVRRTEALVRKMLDASNATDKRVDKAGNDDPDIRSLEQRLSDQLGAKVAIAHGGNGRGALKSVITAWMSWRGFWGIFADNAIGSVVVRYSQFVLNLALTIAGTVFILRVR